METPMKQITVACLVIVLIGPVTSNPVWARGGGYGGGHYGGGWGGHYGGGHYSGGVGLWSWRQLRPFQFWVLLRRTLVSLLQLPLLLSAIYHHSTGNTTCLHPAIPAGCPTKYTRLLVLLHQPRRLLSLYQGMPKRLATS